MVGGQSPAPVVHISTAVHPLPPGPPIPSYYCYAHPSGVTRGSENQRPPARSVSHP